MPNLKIFENPDMLHLGVAVSAYGDSLGDGVIVEVKGEFQGIGPEVIEVSAPFVPGNSGGPVIDSKTGKVIGVSTYGRIIRQSDDALTGSRFAARGYKPAVRRFATRIDNLDPDKFERVTKEQIREDQEKHKPFAQAYDYILGILQDQNYYSASSKIQRIREYFRTHSQFDTGGKWHTSFLKKDAMEKWTFLCNIRDWIQTEGAFSPKNLNETAEEEKFRHVWQKYCDAFEIRKKKPVVLKCPACDGSGKIKEKLSEYEAKVNARKMRPTYTMVPCPICGGKQNFTFGENREYRIAPPEFYDKIAETVKPMPKKFMGFLPGEKITDLNTRFDGFYQKKNRKVSRSGIFTVYSFKGNHKDKEAAETRLWFIGEILMRIDLFYPVRSDSFTNEIYQELIREYGDDMPFCLCEVRKVFTWDEIKRSLQKQGRVRPDERTSSESFAKQMEKSKAQAAHVQAAYDTDPFCLYCFPQKQEIRKISRFRADYGYHQGYYHTYYRDDTEEPRFICISFLHTFFKTCADPNIQKSQRSSRFGSEP